MRRGQFQFKTMRIFVRRKNRMFKREKLRARRTLRRWHVAVTTDNEIGLIDKHK